MKKMDEALGDFILHGLAVEEEPCYLLEIPTMPWRTVADQLAILSKLPNYHWWEYVKVVGGTCSQPTVRFSSHLLFSPDESQTQDGCLVNRFVPTSPRNRLMYFVGTYNVNTFIDTLRKLASVEYGKDSMFLEDPADSDAPPAKKRKRHAGAKILRVNKVSLSEELGLDLNSELNCQDEGRKLFSKFSEQLANDGLIQWRHHSTDDSEVVVLSDYDPSTGIMMPSSFVHVVSSHGEDGELLVKCSCDTYSLIQKALVQKFQLVPGCDTVLDVENTCMHCRFFKEHLMNFWDILGQYTPLSQLHHKIQFCIPDMHAPLLLVGEVYPTGVTKFSVRGEDNLYSIMTIAFRMGECQARCTEGVCLAKTRNKKKIPRKTALDKTPDLCSHLLCLADNLHEVKALFPEFFNPEAEEEAEAEEPQQPAVDPGNTEDQTLPVQKPGIFDVETGLWNFPSYSQHCPRDMMDPQLVW